MEQTIKLKPNEYIILALKDNQGDLFIFETDRQKSLVTIGESTTMNNFAPFPFNVFSSLDDDAVKGFQKTYLKVALKDNLSDKELDGMSSNGIRYYHFGKKEIEIISEFTKPFRYALEYLNYGRGTSGTYNLTTWLIHEETRTNDELKAMEEIIKIAYTESESGSLDISLDYFVLPYLPILKSISNGKGITFGRYGKNHLDKKDVLKASKNGLLSLTDVLYLAERIMFPKALYYHNDFNEEFYMENIADTSLEYDFLVYLGKDEIEELVSDGIDISYLPGRSVKHMMNSSYGYFFDGNYDNHEAYGTIRELVEDDDYKAIIKTHDPYEFYCCPDCDGYEMDYDLEAYDYTVDEQVEVLQKILNPWGKYLDESSVHLFEDWSSDTFKRVSESENVHPFVGILNERFV